MCELIKQKDFTGESQVPFLLCGYVALGQLLNFLGLSFFISEVKIIKGLWWKLNEIASQNRQ